MIFNVLNESADKGELILVEGGMLRWHLRQDGQITIHEILVLPECRDRGVGRAMLDRLRSVPGAGCILAKCPAGAIANAWYRHMGFEFVGIEETRSGSSVTIWRLPL